VHSHGGDADRNIAVGVHWQMFVGNQDFPPGCGLLVCLRPHGQHSRDLCGITCQYYYHVTAASVAVAWQQLCCVVPAARGGWKLPCACREICSRTIKNVWSTGAILSHSKRLNHSWPGPVSETCKKLRKRQLTHEVRPHARAWRRLSELSERPFRVLRANVAVGLAWCRSGLFKIKPTFTSMARG
jgi:hypothetical protein